MKVIGLIKRSSPKPIIGYSDTETVKLDFDYTHFRKVKYWALRTMNWFKLGGFIILKSSEQSYHVLFDREVSWSENMRVVAWVSLLAHCSGLHKWCLMQCIKESSTLRVSHKREKPPPRIVYRYGDQNEQVQNFLEYRALIKKINRKITNAYGVQAET